MKKNLTLFFIKGNKNSDNQLSVKLNINELSIKPPSSKGSQESKLFITKKRNKKIITNHRNSITRDLTLAKSKNKIKRRSSFFNNSENRVFKEINIVNMNQLKTWTKEDEENSIKKKSKRINKNINYNFSLQEIISCLLCPCFISGNLKIKYDYNNIATQFIYKKLDIILYVRNMVLFDIINETILDDDKKNIINFLSRPILHLDKKENKNIFYQNYYEKDFDKFYDSYLGLVRLEDKINREKRLMLLSKLKLKELI